MRGVPGARRRRCCCAVTVDGCAHTDKQGHTTAIPPEKQKHLQQHFSIFWGRKNKLAVIILCASAVGRNDCQWCTEMKFEIIQHQSTSGRRFRSSFFFCFF